MAIKFSNHKKYILILLGLFVLISSLLLNADLPKENDEPYYFVLAKSLVLQQGYNHIYYPGEDALIDVEYPFLYPVLLALAMKFISAKIIFLKSISILFGIAALIVSYIFFRNKYKQEHIETTTDNNFIYQLLLFLLLIGTNWWFISFSVIIAPEILYLCFSVLALYFLEKYANEKPLFNKYFFITAFMFAASFYTKSLGLTLILASFIYFCFIKKEYKKGLILAGISFLLVLPWFIRNSMVTNTDTVISQNYLDQVLFGYKHNLQGIVKSLLLNIINYGKAISSMLVPGYFLGESKFEGLSYTPLLCSLMNKDKLFNPQVLPLFTFFIMFFSAGMTAIGFIRNFLKKKSAMEIYLLCYLGILIMLPPGFYINAGKRYLVVLVPFIFYYFFIGLSLCEIWISKNKKESSVLLKSRQKILNYGKFSYLVYFVLLLSSLMPVFGLLKGNISYLSNSRFLSEQEKQHYYSFWLNDYFSLAEWIRANTPADAVLMHFFPAAFYLHTNRKTVFFNKIPYWPETREWEDIKSDIEKKNVNYIVVGSTSQEDIIYWLNVNVDNYIFIPIAQIEVNRVYKAVKIDPAIKAIYTKGAFLYKNGNYILAIEEFKKAQKIEPTFIGYFNLGRCYEEMGNEKKSMEMYRQSMLLDPEFEEGKFKFEIAYYKELISNDPVNYTYYEKIGESYLRSYRYERAIEMLNQVLALNPVSHEVHYKLGLAYLGTKEYERAIIEFRKTYELVPKLKERAKHYIKVSAKLKLRNKGKKFYK